MTDDLHDPTEWLKELIITQRKTIEQQLKALSDKDQLILWLQSELENAANAQVIKAEKKVKKDGSIKQSSTASRSKTIAKRKKTKH